jgi:hypothetical protein
MFLLMVKNTSCDGIFCYNSNNWAECDHTKVMYGNTQQIWPLNLNLLKWKGKCLMTVKTREALPGHLLYDLYEDAEMTIHYLMDSYEEWKDNWRQVPLKVTEALETVGAKFRHDQHLMEQRKPEILQELKQYFPEVWQYFHPDGEFSSYHWDYARSAFWCRLRYKKMGRTGEEVVLENQ